jgi:hypothetical protein
MMIRTRVSGIFLRDIAKSIESYDDSIKVEFEEFPYEEKYIRIYSKECNYSITARIHCFSSIEETLDTCKDAFNQFLDGLTGVDDDS